MRSAGRPPASSAARRARRTGWWSATRDRSDSARCTCGGCVMAAGTSCRRGGGCSRRPSWPVCGTSRAPTSRLFGWSAPPCHVRSRPQRSHARPSTRSRGASAGPWGSSGDRPASGSSAAKAPARRRSCAARSPPTSSPTTARSSSGTRSPTSRARRCRRFRASAPCTTSTSARPRSASIHCWHPAMPRWWPTSSSRPSRTSRGR